METIFECEYRGSRCLGFGRPPLIGPSDVYEVDLPVVELLKQYEDEHHYGAIGDFLRSRIGHRITVGDTGAFHLRPPMMPAEQATAIVSGFGLTHKTKRPPQTDNSKSGAQGYPAWFFKGFGSCLKSTGQRLTVPKSAVGVCEEAEVVMVYLVDSKGCPQYLGYSFGNDLTDIGQIKANSSHLSYGKLCDCAIAATLVLAPPPVCVDGSVSIDRDGQRVWDGLFTTGTSALFFDLDHMLQKLWSHASLRPPSTVHYVYLGADKNSSDYGFGIRDRDIVTIRFAEDAVLSNQVWIGEADEFTERRPIEMLSRVQTRV